MNRQRMTDNKNIVISKDAIQRLLRDVKNIMRNPLTDNGIYYIHDDEDLLKGYAMIVGPSETPYFGGFYFFEFLYPADYPHSPPTVKYMTNGDNIRFNPNLYVNGKVCISLLNTWRGEQWTSCQSISTVLLNLCTLLCADPLLNEPGVGKTHPDFNNYTKIVEYKNIEIAILRMVTRDPGSFCEKFGAFYPILKENFIKNSDAVAKYLIDKVNNETAPEKLITSLYSMNTVIDYKKLHKKYVNVANEILNSSN
jgi:ubiquitin-conjugating enzyme E2 Z